MCPGLRTSYRVVAFHSLSIPILISNIHILYFDYITMYFKIFAYIITLHININIFICLNLVLRNIFYNFKVGRDREIVEYT